MGAAIMVTIGDWYVPFSNKTISLLHHYYICQNISERMLTWSNLILELIFRC